MSAVTYFIQSCPTCGRRLQIRVEYLGRDVSCYHCSARFPADCTPPGVSVPSLTLSDLTAGNDSLLDNCTCR
ncbi:MAG: hypothetical protein LBQ54_06425 [Planctomycetaceae bacterium]|nr:hypothetical protein [Planctomycetaceae bacterium]